MKTILVLFFAASLFASLLRAGENGSANKPPTWVDPNLPSADAQGWKTLFDGQRVYGANPTNANFLSGDISLKNNLLVVDCSAGYTGGIRFKWKGTNVAVRFHGRKLGGQHLGIGFGGYTAWFNENANLCGIGQSLRGKYRELKTASVSGIDEFYTMEFQLVGDKLSLLINGVVKIQTTAPWVVELRQIEVAPFKAVGIFRKIEAREIGRK